MVERQFKPVLSKCDVLQQVPEFAIPIKCLIRTSMQQIHFNGSRSGCSARVACKTGMLHLSSYEWEEPLQRVVTTCDLQLFPVLSIDDSGGVQVHGLINGFSPATMPLSGHAQLDREGDHRCRCSFGKTTMVRRFSPSNQEHSRNAVLTVALHDTMPRQKQRRLHMPCRADVPAANRAEGSRDSGVS